MPVTRLARSRSFPFGVWCWCEGWEGVLGTETGAGTGTGLGLAGVEFVRVDPATLDPRGAPRLVLLMLLAVLMAPASNLRGKLTGGADKRFLVEPAAAGGGPEPDILNLLGFAATKGTATGVSWGGCAAGVERMASTMEVILEGLWMRTVSEPLCSDAVECARGLREAIRDPDYYSCSLNYHSTRNGSAVSILSCNQPRLFTYAARRRRSVCFYPCGSRLVNRQALGTERMVDIS